MSKLPKIRGMKKVMHMVTCFGAATVILGALFKIMHYPGASIMLPAGLIVETFLFIFFGFDIPHEEVDWTLAYPELAGMGHGLETMEKKDEEAHLTATAQLDNLLADAKIGPELMESLGTGIKSLTDTTSKIADISNATIATNEYVDSMKGATKSVGQLSETYSKAATTITALAENNDVSASVVDSLNKVSKNFNAIIKEEQVLEDILEDISNISNNKNGKNNKNMVSIKNSANISAKKY